MAKKGLVQGVVSLAEGAASTVAKATTGAALSAVKGARRLVAAKPARKKVRKRAVARKTGSKKTTSAKSMRAMKGSPRKAARKKNRKKK